MQRKIVWGVVSGWMVAALLLASCAPAVVEEEEKVASRVPKEVETPKEVVEPKGATDRGKGAEMVKWIGKRLDGTVVEVMKEKPRYGGINTDFIATQPRAFESSLGGNEYVDDLTNEPLIYHDWARGQAGTREWGPVGDPFPEIGVDMGMLAESWEIVEPGYLVFHIRKGVHFALDPTSEASRLVGGREMTADDVVFTLRRGWTVPTAVGKRFYWYALTDNKNVENSIYVSPDDPWAVVMEAQPGMASLPLWVAATDFNSVLAPEAIEKYGSLTSSEWKNVVGTGPFMLKDYVTGSALTWVRNPNYWMHDPFFPENQLPYIDTLKVLIIPDISTRMAAIRVGKIDKVYDVLWEDARSLLKTNPELKWIQFTKGAIPAIMINNESKPFTDIRVRQALMTAVNYRELTDLYYDGQASLFNYPIPAMAQFSDTYTPLEEMPESVQELYGYHPDKSRQLLAEAGYPDGFSTQIFTTANDVDVLSIIKAYWADIGVELQIDVRDPSAITPIYRTYEQMVMNVRTQATQIYRLSAEEGKDARGNSNISSPIATQLKVKVNHVYFNPGEKEVVLTGPLSEVLPSVPEAQGMQKNWPTYANEQAWFIVLPEPYLYIFWQPWVKGFYGTYSLGIYAPKIGNARYLWIDQELKESMGR